MEIAINDLSFSFLFYSEKQALMALRKFIYLCKEIEYGNRCTKVERLVVGKIDKMTELAPNCKLIKLIQQLKSRDEQKYLLGLLTNREKIKEMPQLPFCYKEKESFVCAWAVDKAVVSLASEAGLSGSEIRGKIGMEAVSIANLSEEAHIDVHGERLGVRIFQANDEKHKKERVNYYGKGKSASPMDLDDATAQNLLNHAIWIKGRLYGRKHGKNYAFQCTGGNVYHGYIADDLRDDILHELNAHKWE
jgi:hypothetical protein